MSMDLGDILHSSKNIMTLIFDRVKDINFNAYIVSGAGRTFIEFFYDDEV